MHKPKLGSGKRFASLKEKIQKQGYSEEAASAIAANAGRKAHGAKQMAKYAHEGHAAHGGYMAAKGGKADEHMVTLILGKMKPKAEDGQDTPFHDIDAEEHGEENDHDLDNDPPEHCIEAAAQVLDALKSGDPKFVAQALIDFLILVEEDYDEEEKEEGEEPEEEESDEDSL